jgi:hypothetical protein
MLAPYHSELSWNQQLLAERIGRETGKELQPQLKELAGSNRVAVREQTLSLVASNEALSRQLGSNYEAIEGTLRWGLQDIAGSIHDLGAEFSYGASLLVAELQIQNRTLDAVLQSLDAMQETLRTPVQTKAQEYFREAYRLIGQKLLAEARDYLQRGLAEYDVDFVAQYHLGLLYLYGRDEDDDVIDLPAAEHHLRLAARYAIPLVEQVSDARRYSGEARFHASVACYAQAGELRRAGQQADGEPKLREAVALASESIQVHGGLTEAKYHLAKYHALLGKLGEVEKPLHDAVVYDRSYLLKASMDSDFDNVRPTVDALAEKMRQEVRDITKAALSRVEEWRTELCDVLSQDVWPQAEAGRLLSTLEEQFREMQRLAQMHTYFDYWKAYEPVPCPTR